MSNLMTYFYFAVCMDKDPDIDAVEWMTENSVIDKGKPFDCARIIGTPYDTQDGMNSCVLALTTFTAGGTIIGDYGNKILLGGYSLYRGILDRCKTVDDAITFLDRYTYAHNGIVDEETAFRLLHENHIPGDENYSVIFNLTKRTAAVQFASDFAVMYRYQL